MRRGRETVDASAVKGRGGFVDDVVAKVEARIAGVSSVDASSRMTNSKSRHVWPTMLPMAASR
jgi:hypothetical protein